MNFALSAVILVLLLLPGGTVLKAYYTSVFAKKSNIELSFNEVLLKGLVYSSIIHLVALIVLKASGYVVDISLLYNIIIGNELKVSGVYFTNAVEEFIIYTLILVFFSWVVAKRFKQIVLRRKWDLNIYALRNRNYWYHVFSGDYLEMNGVQGDKENADVIFIDLLMEDDIIYSGFVLDFNYNPKKDELENIVLHNATKQSFRKTLGDYEKKERLNVPIPGDVFLIPIKRVVNMNIFYLQVTMVTNGNVDMLNGSKEISE